MNDKNIKNHPLYTQLNEENDSVQSGSAIRHPYIHELQALQNNMADKFINNNAVYISRSVHEKLESFEMTRE